VKKDIKQISQKNVQAVSNQVNTSKQSLWLQLILVFCIPVVLYIQTVSFDLTHFDDDGIISNNISMLGNLKNIPKAFTNDAYVGKTSEFYRPLQTVSYMIDVRLSNNTATWMFHLSNVLLFGLFSCLLFAFLLRFSIPKSFAVIATLLYAVNPLFSSCVAWIPARGDLLLGGFSLASFILFIDFNRTGKTKYLFFHWLTFTIALFCKETAAFLPFLMALYYVFFIKKKVWEQTNIVTVILYAISGCFWFWIRSKSIGDVSTKPDLFQTGIFSLLNNLRTIPESLTAFVLPFNIAVIPGYSLFRLTAGLILLGIIIYFTIQQKQRLFTEKVFCFLWFLLLLVPTMMFRHLFIDYLNHRFLLPFIGIWLFILFLIPEKLMREQTLLRILIGLIVIFSIFTFRSLHDYTNASSFYDAAIKENPRSAFALNNRGTLKCNSNDYQGALDDFNAALAINNSIAETYQNIGLCQFNLKNFKAAIDNYTIYLKYRPHNANAYNNIGMSWGSLGNFTESLASFTKAITLNPQFMEAYGNRAIVRFKAKDYDGVLKDCNMVLQIEPNEPKALNLKSTTLEMMKEEGNIK